MSAQGQKNYVYSNPLKKTKLSILQESPIDARNFSLISVSFDWTLTSTPVGDIKLFYSYDKVNWFNSTITPINLATLGHGEFIIQNSTYPFYKTIVNVTSGGTNDTIDMFLLMR